MGVAISLSNEAMLMAGARWLHISNASKDGSRNNPGYDSVQLYAGLMIPF